MVVQLTPDLIVDCRDELGEGPTWDAQQDRLLWLDVDGQKLHELDVSGVHHSTDLSHRVSAVVSGVGGELIAVAGLEIAPIVDGRLGTSMATLPSAGDGFANDGRCDPHGRLWVGTVDRSGDKAAGLFSVADDGSVTKVRGGVALSNGIDWSPDGATCYYVDSFAHRIEAMHLDAGGFPTSSETLVDIDAIPDGLSVDAEGAVWVALWDGGAVHRYLPDGRLDKVVVVPDGFVTSCAFGGGDSTTLFITTAWSGMSSAERASQPGAGALLAVDAGVSGRGYTSFGRSADSRSAAHNPGTRV